MVDALVSSVLGQLTSIIQREFEKEVKLVVGVREEIGKLSSALTMLQAVLDDAEEKQVKEKAVKLWLEKLRDVVYDADDVLDEWNTRTIVSQIQGVDNDSVNGGIRKKVLSYLFSSCFCFKDVVVRHDIGHRIKEVRERLNVIAEEKNQYNLVARRTPDRPRHLTSSLIDVSEVYGRDEEKADILGMLYGDNSSQVMPVRVISIIGTGGFGKTTLARLILKEEKVTTAFEKKMWVCVSEPFDRVRVAKEIIEQAGEKVQDVIGWDALHKCLCESLRGKKFLLVLDDVWTDDANDWDPLKLALEGGASGSRVLITTRNETVAQMIGCTQIHKLGVLPEDYSWLMFRRIAFQGREDTHKLENIGKQIAKKCKGVPLSVRSIASLMLHKKTEKDWNDVLTSEIWNIKNVEKDILPSLFLSYYPLPSDLKQCFMYCAVFPKDTVLKKDWLVKLWMAQGFLGSDGSRDLEKIGEEYYDDLAMRSFFQDFDRDLEGNITSCKMHDLVHDFATFLSKSECSILETKETKFDESKVRHIAAIKDLESSSIYLAKNLRTLLTPFRIESEVVPIELYYKLTCLRTLDLGGCFGIKELPNEVGNLLHLRYLNLWDTELSELPETVTNLYNLQTLGLDDCSHLQKLPDNISKLSNLRHLEIAETFDLRYLPRGIGRLGFLRTLCKFIVDGGSKGCKIGELKSLNFLQGDLEIEGLERVGDMNEAAEAELEKKKDLHGLTLCFGDTEASDAEKMEGVLKNLQPHQNLEALRINGYPGLQFPDWITSASNLGSLVLYSCKKLRVLPDLPKLKSLYIRDCPELGGVQPCLPPLLVDLTLYGDVGVFSKSLPVGEDDECYHNIKSVVIESSPHSSLPKGLNQLTSIQSLTLYDCKTLDFELEELKHLTMLQELEITVCPILEKRFGEGKDWSILSQVPKIIINDKEIARSN